MFYLEDITWKLVIKKDDCMIITRIMYHILQLKNFTNFAFGCHHLAKKGIISFWKCIQKILLNFLAKIVTWKFMSQTLCNFKIECLISFLPKDTQKSKSVNNTNNSAVKTWHSIYHPIASNFKVVILWQKVQNHKPLKNIENYKLMKKCQLIKACNKSVKL